MKKFIVSGIAAATLALSMGAQAADVSYLDYEGGTLDYGNGFDGDYSALSLTVETPIVPLFSVQVIDYDGVDILKAGVGGYAEVGTGYVYGLVHYNDYDVIDSDFTLTAGVNAFLTESFEVRLSASEYTDHDGLSNVKAGLAYYLTESVSLSANYTSYDNDTDATTFSARLNF